MKNVSTILILVLVLVGGGYWYLQAKQEQPIVQKETAVPSLEIPQETTPLEDGAYSVSAQESTAQWEGRKPLLANYVDRGTLAIKSGTATVEGGEIKSGSLVFDMNSIQANVTGKNMGEDMLSKHLKSDAFFDVQKFPESVFTLKSAISKGGDTYVLRGDLTMKSITHELEFEAILTAKNGVLSMQATAAVDRTQWDIRFGSGKFFENLADNIIDDFFKVQFAIRALKS